MYHSTLGLRVIKKKKLPGGRRGGRRGARRWGSNVKRFRGGLVFKAHRLCVSLDSRLESHKEEELDDVARGLRVVHEHRLSHPLQEDEKTIGHTKTI